MATITKSIVIEAPVTKVFSYLDEPVNLPEIWPSMVEVDDVATLPTGGYRFHWIYKMAGMRFEGDARRSSSTWTGTSCARALARFRARSSTRSRPRTGRRSST